MIDRVFTTYSILTYLTDKGMSQMDLYIPLACKSILNHNATTVSASDLEAWFEQDYGLDIYKGVFANLVKTLASTGYLNWKTSQYEVDKEKVIKRVEKCKDDVVENSFNQLCDKIIRFCTDKYAVTYSVDEIQSGLLEFFHKHDGDVMFSQEKMMETLKRQKDDKTTPTKVKYIISQFILWSKDNDAVSFDLIKHLSKGHALASIVSMKDMSSYEGKMKGVVIALDTPMIFNLLHLNEKNSCDLTIELLEILQKQGASFVMYEQHYQELNKTISSTIYLLKTRNYTWEKASKLLKYALRNRISSHEIATKQQQVDSILKKWSITVERAPDYPAKYNEIDIQKLQTLIEDRYKETGEELDENRMKTISNDVDVISYIFRLRGNNVASNLHNSKAIFVTSNTSLAYASKHPDISSIHHVIPACLTDTFLSTILWFNYPESKGDINEKILISECYRNITLSDDILLKFYKDVERINSESALTEEIMLTVNTSQMVQELLENKTYNDNTLYTSTTAAEILEEIEHRKNSEIKSLKGEVGRHSRNVYRLSRGIAIFCYFLLWGLLASLFLFLKFIDYKDWSIWWRWVVNILSILPTLWGLLSWVGWICPKANIIDRIAEIVYTQLYKWLNRE